MPAILEDNTKTGITNDPAIFSFHSEVEIFADADQKEKDNIRLTLYDGSVVKHWYWGNLAFDLKTMRLAKKRIPILDAHDTDRPLGFSTGAGFDGKFTLDGKFLKNEIAMRRRTELEDGFPYEASLRFNPDKSKIELVRQDETAEVNGHILRGPGAVIRNAMIMEGSMCVFGALNNCKTENFENVLERFGERKNTMENGKTVLTIESFEKENPEIFKQIFEKGKEASKVYFEKMLDACGDDVGLLIEFYKAGKTAEEALKERNNRLVAKNKELQDAAAKNTGKDKKVDPAINEFSDEQDLNKNRKPAGKKTEDELKKEFQESEELQNEFGRFEAYLAFVRAEKSGRIISSLEKKDKK